MYKGIVFDLDHTLFDRYATLRAVLPVMYAELRGNIAERISEGEFIDAVIAADRSDIHHGWRHVIRLLRSRGVFTADTEEDPVLDCLLERCWPVAAIKFDFTDSVLQRLRGRGYKLGIITNGTVHSQQNKIDLLGIAHYFDEIIISAAIGFQKPDREPFDVMSQRLGIPAGELIYVGDNPLCDVDGSRRAGYTPVWVHTTDGWIFDDIERCEYEVATINELPDLLDRIDK